MNNTQHTYLEIDDFIEYTEADDYREIEQYQMLTMKEGE